MYTGRVSDPIAGSFCIGSPRLLSYSEAHSFHSLDCQNDLSKSITKLNSKSKLFVIREALQTLLPKLFKEWKVTHLVFEKDPDGYGQERDEEILKLAKEANVKTITKSGRTLYDIDELIKANSDKPTMSMSQVQHVRNLLSAVNLEWFPERY